MEVSDMDTHSALANADHFIGEVNRGIEERTFCRVFTIIGGPMDMYNGQIGTFK